MSMTVTLLGRLVRREFHAMQVRVPPCVHVTEEPVVRTRSQQVCDGNANTTEYFSDLSTPPRRPRTEQLDSQRPDEVWVFESRRADLEQRL
jgi:hypothetical protein